MQVQLPQQKIVNDCYGIYTGLREYAGAREELKYSVMHGWQPSTCFPLFENFFVEHIKHKYLFSGSRRLKVLVNTELEKECFEFQNINTDCIGLPFFYLEDHKEDKLERIKDSILFVPLHGCIDFDSDEYYNKNEDFNECQVYMNKFDCHFMVHHHDVEKGRINKTFKIIPGARLDDANTFLKMKYIFSQFEYACFFGFTSAIIYASLFGCKVFLAKNYRNPDPAEVSKINKIIPLPVLRNFYSAVSRDKILADFPFVGDGISSASFSREIALKELGYECKKSRNEIRSLIEESNMRMKRNQGMFGRIDRLILRQARKY